MSQRASRRRAASRRGRGRPRRGRRRGPAPARRVGRSGRRGCCARPGAGEAVGQLGGGGLGGRTSCRRPGRARRGRPASRRRRRTGRPRARSPRPGGGARSALSSRSNRSAVRFKTAFASEGKTPGSRPIRAIARGPAVCQASQAAWDDSAASARAGRSPLRASSSSLSLSRALDSLPTASITLLGAVDQVGERVTGRRRSPSGRGRRQARGGVGRIVRRGGRRPRPSRGPSRRARRPSPALRDQAIISRGAPGAAIPSGRQSAAQRFGGRRAAPRIAPCRARRSSSVAASRDPLGDEAGVVADAAGLAAEAVGGVVGVADGALVRGDVAGRPSRLSGVPRPPRGRRGRRPGRPRSARRRRAGSARSRSAFVSDLGLALVEPAAEVVGLGGCGVELGLEPFERLGLRGRAAFRARRACPTRSRAPSGRRRPCAVRGRVRRGRRGAGRRGRPASGPS